jgi:hypothetical protein
VKLKFCFLAICFVVISNVHAQKNARTNLVYVDKQGVLRYTADRSEASFFGVNYTVPFAYGYRSHKALGIDIEKAIDNDVYHMWRLGLNAFRVHVWDTEITDTAGNLISNEHLRLFDYLIAKLRERNIKTLITPIAFWGNGYPERDEKTPGFAFKYGKQEALVNDTAINAQENYLKQFFTHVNPYTKRAYKDDPLIIAMEINNEPHHTGPKQNVTNYVNRMAQAVKSTGWTKPIFYNISESPTYADAVADANLDGHSFQWYPTGLVANRTLQGNYLPNVDVYTVPFYDTIPKFRNRAKMVYEFDAGDVWQPIMYPAMARSFRTAGFQWATQFAYDPMATAYANTEYQTHYLNLAYTPAKAISLLIAAKVFHNTPLNKSYGKYPADTLFESYRISYDEQLCEMNSPGEFYYSISTNTRPVNTTKLKHIAGVGSSPIIKYTGTGAYFLDQLAPGIWRLEVMPDAIVVSDPFAKASPKKPVVQIDWRNNKMAIDLPDLGNEFMIKGLNKGNDFTSTSNGKLFSIMPGTYLLQSSSIQATNEYKIAGAEINEFVAPPATIKSPIVIHQPSDVVSAGKPLAIVATIAGVFSSDKITLETHNSSNKWKTVDVVYNNGNKYSAEIPAEIITPGVVNYRFIIQKNNGSYVTFPGNHADYPYAWDAYENENWQTHVAAPGSDLEIFNPNVDRNTITIYNPDWRKNSIEYISAKDPKQLILKATKGKNDHTAFGFEAFIATKLQGRRGEINNFISLAIHASSNKPVRVKINLINKHASSFAAYLNITSASTTHEILLSDLHADSALILPRPYPSFLPLYFKPDKQEKFSLADIEKIQITFGRDVSNASTSPTIIEIGSVWFQQQKMKL